MATTLLAATGGTMYTNLFDILFVDIAISCFPAGIMLLVGLALRGAGYCPRFYWPLWQFLLALTAGSAYGKIHGWQLACTITTGLVFIALRWARTRKWLYGGWVRGLITTVIIIGFFALVWLI